MNNIKNNYLFLAILLIFSACMRVDDQAYDSLDNMLESKKNATDFTTVESLHAMIEQQKPGFAIIDVREPDEFEAGHIPGAVNVPRGILEFSNHVSNRRNTYFLYSNHDGRSILAASNLKLLKFNHVYVVENGFDHWRQMYPEQIDTGSGTVQVAPAKQTPSGGCGD